MTRREGGWYPHVELSKEVKKRIRWLRPLLPAQVPNAWLPGFSQSGVEITKQNNLISFGNAENLFGEGLPPFVSGGVGHSGRVARNHKDMKWATHKSDRQMSRRPAKHSEIISLKETRPVVLPSKRNRLSKPKFDAKIAFLITLGKKPEVRARLIGLCLFRPRFL